MNARRSERLSSDLLGIIALGPNAAAEIGYRQIPVEPMYLIINLGELRSHDATRTRTDAVPPHPQVSRLISVPSITRAWNRSGRRRPY